MDNTTIDSKKIEEGFVGQRMVVASHDLRQTISNGPLGKCLYPTAVGFYPRASYHDRERKTGSEQYILLYCVDGKGWIRINGKEHILLPNTFFIIPKGVPHHYGSSQQEPWSIYWVHFTGDHAKHFYSRFRSVSADSVPYIAFSESRGALFNELISYLENDFSHFEPEAVYINLFRTISSFLYQDRASLVSNDVIAGSIELMKADLKARYNIKELAAQVNYSVSRYSELFRLKTGFAPMQYLLHLRIKKSCQYLYFTKLNIKEICRETGFEDPYYFSRMFKKQMGQSPLHYRRAYKI